SPIPRGPAHRAPSPGLKPKDLLGLPWMLAFALRADGWYLRSDIIWAKPNPMPESVRDRPTSAHEHLFLLSKRERYYYDAEAIREPAAIGDHPRNVREVIPSAVPGAAHHTGIRHQIPRPPKHPAGWASDGAHTGLSGRYTPKEALIAELADSAHRRRTVGSNGRTAQPYELLPRYSPGHYRNKRNVWVVATQPYPEAHFATFPGRLVEPCVLAGCPERGVVLDPFAGSGTTLAVAKRLNRDSIGIELNPAYLPLIARRCEAEMAQPELPLELSRAENRTP
ncbi:MAG: DNA-methyltransferase, partial [Candidatus Dormibacteria bacterium]